MNGSIELLVGGVAYNVDRGLLLKHPDSFFANLLSDTWRGDAGPITINRDGTLFKVIVDFLFYGYLPRDKDGRCSFDVDALKEEADFYNLTSLIEECDEQKRSHGKLVEIETFRTVNGEVSYAKNHDNSLWQVIGDADDAEEADNAEDAAELITALGAALAPFCVRGTLDHTSYELKTIYKSSTVGTLNIPELLAGASQSPFGRGTETVLDTTVRNSLEIPASQLDNNALNSLSWRLDIADLHPMASLLLRPYKLVIYPEGGHFEEHRDTVRGDNHIGTLVLILNSEYTGGELEISHGDKTEVVTGPYNWVAMYGDCLHKINPVTSGTRVSLIYDIYSNPQRARTVWDVYSPYVFKIGKMLNEEEENTAFALDPAKQQAIVNETQKVIATGVDVAICLQHLYPACQANPDFLKGGDQLLYDALKGEFATSIVPVTIHRRRYCQYSDYSQEDNRLCAIPYKATTAAVSALRPTKLVIPAGLSRANVLHDEEIDYTGNESQGTDTVYIVACLVVSKK